MNGDGDNIHISCKVSQDCLLCLHLLSNSGVNRQMYLFSTLKCGYCIMQ